MSFSSNDTKNTKRVHLGMIGEFNGGDFQILWMEKWDFQQKR